MKDKTILVTGASRGVGAKIAAHYAGNNQVIGISRSGKAPEDVTAVDIDITVGQWEAVGPIDVLINNAAVLTTKPLLMMDPEAATAMVETNLLGPILLTRAVIKGMMRRKWGRIINITSMATRVCVPGDSVYAATKAGLETFTRVVNREVHRYGITANCIGISAIDTDMLRTATKDKPDAVLPLIPHGKLATIDSVIGAIDYFCGPESGDIGGQTIYLGGV